MTVALLEPDVKSPAEITYEVYGGVHLAEHESIIKNHHLTYDITILPSMMLGKEYNKTIGHYHANIPGTTIDHPQLYEVLHDRGFFILPKIHLVFQNLTT